ncbi:MAG TPA: transketolase C-terminal domain-containing protein, partial [Candidatus Manganitrophaceae bacterium]|nr:transketolase C-terminal domain-containing protein [Candidatus Manganitrophaceae bacterium]
ILYGPSEEFQLGIAKKLAEGSDVTIIANGLMVWEGLNASDLLKEQGISAAVLDIHTLKPIDEAAIVAAAEVTGAVVTAEEHLLTGGLGSRVAEVLSRRRPVPVEMVGIRDTYAESGLPDELFEKYGLTARHIVRAVETVLKRK